MSNVWHTFSRFRSIAVLALLCAHVDIAVGGGKAGPGEVAIITNWGDDTVSVVDLKGGKELATIKVGAKPYDAKVDPTGRYAYISNSGGGDISVIDIQAMLEERNRIQVGLGPRDVELTADGKRLLTANSGDDTISVVDMTTRKVAFTVKVGSMPYGVALAAHEHQALVTNWGENTVSVVDLDKQKEIKRIKVSSLPYTIAVPPPGDRAYVSNFGSHEVTPLDLSSYTATKAVAVGRSPWGLAYTADGKTLVVCDFYSGEVSLLTVSRTVPQAGLAAGAAVTVAETARLNLAALAAKPGVALAAGGTGGLKGRTKNVAVADDGQTAIVSDLANNEIMVLDLVQKSVVRTISVGKAPYGIALLSRQAAAAFFDAQPAKVAQTAK